MIQRYTPAWLAATLLASSLLAACGASPTPITPASPPTDQATATEAASAGRSMTVASVSGTVEVKPGGAGDYSPAAQGQEIGPGDEVRTGKDGSAVLLLDDGTRMVVSPDTSIRLDALEGTAKSPISRFFMSLGRMFAIHKGELPDGAAYEVDTPGGVATIRGSYIGVVYIGGSNSGTVMCLTGRCQYEDVPLGGNQGVRFNQDGQQGDVFALTPVHVRMWSDALGTLDDNGLDGLSGDVQCTCADTSLTCDDGAQYDSFPGCLPPGDDSGQTCGCDGSSLVCADGTVTENSPHCSEGGNVCSCDGTTATCLDGSVTEDDPLCSPEAEATDTPEVGDTPEVEATEIEPTEVETEIVETPESEPTDDSGGSGGGDDSSGGGGGDDKGGSGGGGGGGDG